MMCVKSSEKSVLVAASEQRHVTLAPKARFNSYMLLELEHTDILICIFMRVVSSLCLCISHVCGWLNHHLYVI